jgi:transposase
MPPSNNQPRHSGEPDQISEWLLSARTLLASLATAEQGIEATLARQEISAADAPAIDFLADHVRDGLAWLELPHETAQAEASTELRAALGVLRNLAFAVRRLSLGHENIALRRSCDALIEQSRHHVQAAAHAVDEATRSSS